MDFGGKKTILLVEDDMIIAMNQKMELEDFGYSVLIADSGEKAISAVQEITGIHLILMDIDLGSGLDGIETAAQILKFRNMPIVFLSSHTEPLVVEKTESITSYGYVVKNSGITILDASIKMAFKLFEATMQLKSGKDKLQATLDAVPDLILEVGEDGRCFDFHSPPAYVHFWPVDDLIGKKIPEAYPTAAADVIMAAITEAGKKGFSSGRQYALPGAAGARWFEVSATRKSDVGADARFMILFRDISIHRRFEEELCADRLELAAQRAEFLHETREFETLKAKYSYIYDLSPIAYLTLNDANMITECNLTASVLLGVERDELIGRDFSRFMHEEDLESCFLAQKHGLAGVKRRSGEYRMLKNGAAPFWACLELSSAARHGGGSEYFITLTDISETRASEERRRGDESRIKTLLTILQHPSDTVPQFLDYSLEQAIALTGSKFGYIYRYHEDRGEFVLNSRSGEAAHEHSENDPFSCSAPENNCFWCETVRRRKPVIFNDVKMPRRPMNGFPGGHAQASRFMTVPVFKDGILVGMVGLADKERDYTESDVLQVSLLMEAVWRTTQRIHAEEKVLALLSEKELILKEVHHRVKNNMSTVNNLLSLQAAISGNSSVKAALADAGSRVLSMMVLYDTLYKSPDFSEVRLDRYLPKLVRAIIGNFPGSDSVKLTMDIGEIVLDSSKVSALGILMNEVLANSMKYAFTGIDSGTISVSASLSEGNVTVILQDNGIGMLESVDFKNTDGFGLTLMSRLAKQLEGRIRIEREGGTKIILEFKK